MTKNNLFSVSICMATLNAELVLEDCLSRLASQNFDKTKLELIIADAGSKDKTLEIAKKYNTVIYKNEYQTGEAGKAVAVKKAKNDLILILDSDNFLPHNEWLNNMITAFKDSEIILSEPIKYTWRSDGGYIERYSALIGMNDPICLFLGNYDRWNYLTQKWTEIEHDEEQIGNYLKVKIDKRGIPTIGANGTIFRRKFLQEFLKEDTLSNRYLFDIDIIAKYIKDNGSIKIAKVDEGIIHTFCESDFYKFIRKQKRRIIDMNYYRQLNIRNYDWDKGKLSTINPIDFIKFFTSKSNDTSAVKPLKLLKFIIYTLLIFPIIFQSIVGFTRKKDFAWFFHYPACLVTMIVYVYYTILFKFKNISLDRSNWKQ